MNKRRISLLLLAIVVVGSVFGIKGMISAKTEEQKKLLQGSKPVSITVEVTHAVEEQKKVGMTYKATVEAAEEAIVSSQGSGKVIKVIFENGKAVKAGSPLVQLDNVDALNQLIMANAQLESANALLKKTEAGFATTKLTYERTLALFKQGSVPQVDLDNAKAALDMGNADLSTAKAGIETAKATVQMRETALSQMTIKAPMSGIVDGKAVNLGQFLSPGAVVATVKDVNYVDAVFQVEQDALSDIAVGQSAELKLQGTTDKVYKGVISSIGLSADPKSRVFTAKMHIENKNGELRPGVFAWVDLKAEKLSNVLTLPVDLISGKEGAYYVFVNEGGVARIKPLMLGEVFENRVQIKAGITAKDEIIATNLNTIQDGDLVNTAKK